MRSFLLASVALTATLTSAFAPSIADACGGYMPDPRPAVFAVDAHTVHREGTDRWDHRAFVVLGATTAPADATWKQLAPRTFDGTQIADVADPDQTSTFTLVGPSGTQVVSSNRLSVLKQTFGNRVEHSAVEVGIDQQSQFRIAVIGIEPDAKWLETTAGTATRNTLTWVRKQGMDTEYVYIAKIKGTSIQVISAHGKDAIGLTSFVVVDGESRGTFLGSPIGGLDLGGKRYVLLEREGLITPIAV